jgi:heptosyltransferase-1
VDFQGLMKSALVASASGAARIVGYGRKHLREKPASFLYTESVTVDAVHVVDQHYELAAACGAHAGAKRFSLPQGIEEGELPKEEFVLACPFAGWPSKEWPIARYDHLASKLRSRGVALVLNGHAAVEATLRQVKNAHTHISSVAGLIHATRRAKAVVGLDSGPLHLAAALDKPGVAIFGPTDPCRNGPYGGSIRVLRAPDAVTSYKRRSEADPSMLAITPQMVIDALEPSL